MTGTADFHLLRYLSLYCPPHSLPVYHHHLQKGAVAQGLAGTDHVGMTSQVFMLTQTEWVNINK